MLARAPLYVNGPSDRTQIDPRSLDIASARVAARHAVRKEGPSELRCAPLPVHAVLQMNVLTAESNSAHYVVKPSADSLRLRYWRVGFLCIGCRCSAIQQALSKDPMEGIAGNSRCARNNLNVRWPRFKKLVLALGVGHRMISDAAWAGRCHQLAGKRLPRCARKRWRCGIRNGNKGIGVVKVILIGLES
jgi:hypothetical protein